MIIFRPSSITFTQICIHTHACKSKEQSDDYHITISDRVASHTHTCIHTGMHTRTCMHAHAYTHMLTHTCLHAHAYTHMHAHTCKQIKRTMQMIVRSFSEQVTSVVAGCLTIVLAANAANRLASTPEEQYVHLYT